MPPQEKFSTSVAGLASKDASPDGLCRDSSSEGFPSDKSVKIRNGHRPSDGQQEQVKDMDFDELLPHVGEFGTYQRILFVMMIPFAFFVAWVYFSQIFITLVPEDHWCRVPDLENLTVAER